MILSFKIIALVFFLLPSLAAEASEQEALENLRHRIGALQQEFDKTNESRSEAADALREAEQTINASNHKLKELAQKQIQNNRELEQLQNHSSRLEKNMQGEQLLLGKLLYQQYLGGKQEYLKLFLNNHDPNVVARELQYYEYIAQSRADWLETLRGNLRKLKEVAQQGREKNQQIAALQLEEKNQRQILEKQKQARQQILEKFAQQLKQQKREIGRLQHDENRLSQLVEKLTQILVVPKKKTLKNNTTLPDNTFDGKPFAQLKGKLAFPVQGDILNRFGDSRPDSTVLWKGVFLRAVVNQPVKCVASGRVVFADWLRGFGNLVIVDHGSGYMTLYGNNESLLKQVGDVLHGGDTIATVGNSGGNEQSGLYFELRHESKTLDPLKWIAQH